MDLITLVVRFIAAERSSTGLLEWDNKSDCIEGLVIANHTPIPNPSNFDYLLKNTSLSVLLFLTVTLD